MPGLTETIHYTRPRITQLQR